MLTNSSSVASQIVDTTINNSTSEAILENPFLDPEVFNAIFPDEENRLGGRPEIDCKPCKFICRDIPGKPKQMQRVQCTSCLAWELGVNKGKRC
jgi:hypothetical protein